MVSTTAWLSAVDAELERFTERQVRNAPVRVATPMATASISDTFRSRKNPPSPSAVLSDPRTGSGAALVSDISADADGTTSGGDQPPSAARHHPGPWDTSLSAGPVRRDPRRARRSRPPRPLDLRHPHQPPDTPNVHDDSRIAPSAGAVADLRA